MEDEYSWDEYLSPSQYAAVHHCTKPLARRLALSTIKSLLFSKK